MVRLAAILADIRLRTTTKAPFSERAEAVRDDEDAGGVQEGQDHTAQPVLAAVQPLVSQQPRTVVLDDAADRTEPRAVRLAHLADVRLDTLARPEPAVGGAVVGGVGVEPADGGADDLGPGPAGAGRAACRGRWR